MSTSPKPTAQLEPLLHGRFDADSLARIERAAALASAVHATQQRPDGAPYLSHVLEVAELVLTWCPHADADVVCTALLHDSVEDQAHRLAARGHSEAATEQERALDMVESAFGHDVRRRLALLTNPDFDALARERHGDLSAAEQAGRRAALYEEHVTDAVHADGWVAAIKLADFSTNAWRLGNVRDDARRAKLRRKYAPVMQLFRALLGDLGPEHPLAAAQEQLLRELNDVWARDYAAAGVPGG